MEKLQKSKSILCCLQEVHFAEGSRGKVFVVLCFYVYL